MKAGTERHAVLEAETAGIAVEVPIHTREDAFAVRLLNMEAGLHQLLTTKMTRELPICGLLQVLRSMSTTNKALDSLNALPISMKNTIRQYVFLIYRKE